MLFYAVGMSILTGMAIGWMLWAPKPGNLDVESLSDETVEEPKLHPYVSQVV